MNKTIKMEGSFSVCECFNNWDSSSEPMSKCVWQIQAFISFYYRSHGYIYFFSSVSDLIFYFNYIFPKTKQNKQNKFPVNIHQVRFSIPKYA